ncbi:RICIN domain-containing protein (plasmid) [Streptomyces scopuliridis]|uniref:RICIN domain-containing protein n=1 Tax=Streptomyces scopuliridis TaxID=452529 RepID=A0ACD4ZZU5_9ACTN|nr:RICIN domain-containing protein [Streptomyces scopuliridis]WSC03492.1 RICIN domain-containing protein [Streptomyces scopuliridis]WSC11363.1 RICIN domain-containing protein [Streptomyces scopuliridis]
MPGQHDPPAGETTPSVSVRRAVSVPPPDQEPGAELGPRTSGPAAPDPTTSGPATPDPVVVEPATSSAEPATSSAAPAPSSDGPARRRYFGLRSRSGAAEPVPDAAESARREEPQRQHSSASDEPDNDGGAGLLFASDHDHPDDPDRDEATQGRPRGPMLAAAAIAGVLLISVPIVVLGLSDDDERQTVSTKPVDGLALEPNMSDDEPPSTYVVESPSPSSSPSASKSAASKPDTEVKETPQVVTEKKPVEQATPKMEVKKEVKKPDPLTPRQLANALSHRVNVQLRSVETGKCADLPYFGKGKVDGPVRQYDCRPTTKDNQLWDLKVVDENGGPGGASLFVIKNRQDGLCVDLPNNGAAAHGTKISQYHCNGTSADNQRWWLDPHPGGYWLRNVLNNRCMAVDGGRAAGDDARLKVTDCGDTAQSAQRWSVVSVI